MRFEITDKFIKLHKNKETELECLFDKEFSYDQMIIELRNCGILIAPLDEDILAVGLKIKNNEAQDRAVNDIVMACRNFAIKSHYMNPKMSEDVIVTKFKPNKEYDLFFFDDEEVKFLFQNSLKFSSRIGLMLLGSLINPQ